MSKLISLLTSESFVSEMLVLPLISIRLLLSESGPVRKLLIEVRVVPLVKTTPSVPCNTLPVPKVLSSPKTLFPKLRMFKPTLASPVVTLPADVLAPIVLLPESADKSIPLLIFESLLISTVELESVFWLVSLSDPGHVASFDAVVSPDVESPVEAMPVYSTVAFRPTLSARVPVATWGPTGFCGPIGRVGPAAKAGLNNESEIIAAERELASQLTNIFLNLFPVPAPKHPCWSSSFYPRHVLE